jgi:hypothetical protein
MMSLANATVVKTKKTARRKMTIDFRDAVCQGSTLLIEWELSFEVSARNQDESHSGPRPLGQSLRYVGTRHDQAVGLGIN